MTHFFYRAKVVQMRLCLLLMVVLTASQAHAISLTFQPLNSTVTNGDTIDVDVIVSGLIAADEIVSTYDLFVAYDASILNASSVSFGPYLDDFLFPSIQFQDASDPGLINFGEISFLFDDELAAIQPDSFTLATLTFDTLSVGASDLAFEPHPYFGVNDVKGRGAQILDLTAYAGMITVEEALVSVSEPDSLFLVLLGLLLITVLPYKVSSHS
jgi:hypothetical protein